MARKEDPSLPPPHPLLLDSELRSSPCSRNYGRDSLNGGTGWKSASWNLPEIHHLGCQRKLFMGRWVIRGTLLQSYMWGRVSGEVAGHWVLLAGCPAQQKKTGKWRSWECFTVWWEIPGRSCWPLGAGGHLVLQEQGTGEPVMLQDAGAGESCVCCSNLLSGPTRSRRQNRFPSCNVFPVPSTGKPSVPAGKGKTFKQTRAIFTEQA